MGKVVILMGSKSDMDIMKKAENFLNEHAIETELHVASAHRTPEKVHKIIKEAENTTDVFIAGAGMAAHLGGVIASLTIKPVITVPIKSSLDGLDALLSCVQMPPGIPVATVAINGAKNAAILAMEMMAISDNEIKDKLLNFRNSFKTA